MHDIVFGLVSAFPSHSTHQIGLLDSVLINQGILVDGQQLIPRCEVTSSSAASQPIERRQLNASRNALRRCPPARPRTHMCQRELRLSAQGEGSGMGSIEEAGTRRVPPLSGPWRYCSARWQPVK